MIRKRGEVGPWLEPRGLRTIIWFAKGWGCTLDWAERVTHHHMIRKKGEVGPWTEPRGSCTITWFEERVRSDLGLSREGRTLSHDSQKGWGQTLD